MANTLAMLEVVQNCGEKKQCWHHIGTRGGGAEKKIHLSFVDFEEGLMLTKFIIMLNIREKKNYFLHKGYQVTRDP